MPSVIPYDSSLVLGNIVDQTKLDILSQISLAQAPIDAAQDKMNSFISMKRSLDMTVQELANMNIDPTELIKSSEDAGKQISDAASAYAKIRIAQEGKIQDLKASLPLVNTNVESPIDYNRTQIKTMPLSADSLKLDSQYFSYDSNEQSAQNTIATIKGYISNTTSILGDDFSGQASSSATTQINQQRQNHNVEGTLIITATCTHKNALLLAPFILDVDKAIRVWNSVYKDPSDKIKIDDVASMMQISNEEGTDKEKFLNILSGATFGSCFIGMVHILRKESTSSSQSMVSAAESMQAQFSVSSWFAHESGGFGADSSFSNDIKNLLSSQNITSHINVISMGLIPSIASNNIKVAVQGFTDFSPDQMMGQLAALQNATASEQDSVAASAEASRTGGQLIALKAAQAKSVMSSVGEIDAAQNKILDINSLMTSFEDYVNKAVAGSVGVPINYYLKGITRAELAQMWVSKYFPGKYLSISGDDSAPATAGGAAASGSASS